MRIRLGRCPGEVSICGGIKRLLGQGTHPPRRPPRAIDIYIRRTTYWHQVHRNSRYVTPGGETCTAESSKLKEVHWGTLPMVLSHGIKLDADVDSLVDGFQIANRYFHSRCRRRWYGGRSWNGIGWSPVRRRVRGRGVVNVGGWVTKPRGVTWNRANLGGLVCIILTGILLSSLGLRGDRGGPVGRRGTSGHIGVVRISRCVHLSVRQRPGLPLWGRVDNRHNP